LTPFDAQNMLHKDHDDDDEDDEEKKKGKYEL
jgi:hypothetical protein